MKPFLLFIFALFSVTLCHAQLEKGTRLIEGSFNVGGSSRTDEFNLFGGLTDFESRSNFLVVAPSIGWFTGNNTMVGLGLTYQHNTSKNFQFFNGGQQDPFITRENLFSMNSYYTKFSPLVDKLYLTTTVSFLVGLGTENSEFGDQEQESNILQINFNVVPGLTYFISDKWALQASIGQVFYQFRDAKWKTDIQDEPKNTSHNYGLNFSANTFRIGFQYFLSKRSE